MAVKGNWPREGCTLFDKFCWLYLGDLPEKLRVRVSDDFDPRAFGWDGVQPGKNVEMVTEFRKEGRPTDRARAARRRTRSWQMRRRTRLQRMRRRSASVPMDDPAAPVSEQAFAPMQLRPLTFASREFWILHTTFAANAICSFAVRELPRVEHGLLPDAHGARRALMATRCIRCRDERDRVAHDGGGHRRGVAHVEITPRITRCRASWESRLWRSWRRSFWWWM